MNGRNIGMKREERIRRIKKSGGERNKGITGAEGEKGKVDKRQVGK